MSLRTKIALSIFVIAGSIAYAMILIFDENLASALASGYVAVMITIFFIVNFPKGEKHE